MNPVRITKQFTTMDHYSQDPFNPHPAFPQWSPHTIYPYPYWGTMRKYVKRQRYFMPALENDYIRLTIAPDLGGRVWDIYDKVGGRHLANFNTGVRSYNAGMGLNYTCGGIECNYPMGHSPTTNTLREYSFAEYPDGSASVIISEFDRIWRTRWAIEHKLRPGRTVVEQRVRIYNRTPLDTRYLYWNNCGFILRESSQYIFPEVAGSKHGRQEKTWSWPMWRTQDISHWRNVLPGMLGLYMLDADEPFFGYYDHDEQFGLVHYGDLADLPGKKYWTWGTDADMVAHYRKTHHSMNEVYGEVQSGRIVIQEHLDRVPPETESEWTEVWYPVRNTGEFNGAGPGAVMRAEVVESTTARTTLRVKAMGNGSFPRARLVITSDGAEPVELPMALKPTDAVERIVTVPGKAGPDQHTRVQVRDADGAVLATVRLRKPSLRDSWMEGTPPASAAVDAGGAEQLFTVAEERARDWGNNDVRPLYEKVVAHDAGFSPARRELGKLAIGQGLYEEAAGHFETARKRDSDSLELRYFHGIALLRAGCRDAARKCFELAARYDWEARSLVRLAEMCMQEGDWHHALKHLDRFVACWPRLTRPRGLRAICLRNLARLKPAAAEIAAARVVDGQDPFLQVEAMFISAGRLTLDSAGKKALLTQVRGQEPPLLEAAYDYLAVDLFDEAEAILAAIPKPGPLALFVRAWVAEQRGLRADAMRLLKAACKSEPAYQNAWSLELIPILTWAAELLPRNPRPLFHLGNLFVARRRTADGVALWQKALKLGEKHYLLFSSLGEHARNVLKDEALALDYFRKAARAEPPDLYMKNAVFTSLTALGRDDEALRYMKGEMKAVLTSPPLAYNLASIWLKRADYRSFDAFCEKCRFPANWQLRGPQSLWSRRYFQEALLLIHRGELQRALDLLLNYRRAPERIGLQAYEDRHEPRRWYHIGRIYEKLGRPEDARAAWLKAVAVEHGGGYEPYYWFAQWTSRFHQALALQKLGRKSEADAFFDAMELLSLVPKLSGAGRRELLAMVARGRFAPDDLKDPPEGVKVRLTSEAEA